MKLSPEKKRANAAVRALRASERRVKRAQRHHEVSMAYYTLAAANGDTHAVRVLAALKEGS